MNRRLVRGARLAEVRRGPPRFAEIMRDRLDASRSIAAVLGVSASVVRDGAEELGGVAVNVLYSPRSAEIPEIAMSRDYARLPETVMNRDYPRS